MAGKNYLLKNNKVIKVAIVAPYPAGNVLPAKLLKKRTRVQAKKQHPAPWVMGLCKELNSRKNIDLEIFSHSRHIAGTYKVKHENIKYTFVPKFEPVRSDPYHLFLPAIMQMSPHIKRFCPDIVHGFGTESAYGLLAIFQKLPSVVFIQGIQEKYAPFYEMYKIKIMLRKYLEKFVVKKVDGLVAETEFARKWAKTVTKKNKVRVIPHAYSEVFFKVKPNFQRKRIISIGTLNKRKGCTIVLNAFIEGIKRNPNLFQNSELIFIGDGPLKEIMKKKIIENGMSRNVVIKSQIAHSDMPAEIEKACFLVIGSRVDTSPNVITEAHACGIPVVGTSSGGIPEMITENEDGFIVPTDDFYTMSKRFELLFNDLKLCARMGQNGRKKVLSLNDPSRIADKHIAFYEEIISGEV